MAGKWTVIGLFGEYQSTASLPSTPESPGIGEAQVFVEEDVQYLTNHCPFSRAGFRLSRNEYRAIGFLVFNAKKGNFL